MIDYQRLFHTGVLVRSLEEGMAHYGKTLNLTWAKPFTFDALPLWTPKTGLKHVKLEVTYSIEGPQHLEIQTGSKDSFYDPALSDGVHVGVWVDDVTQEVAAMLAEKWTLIAAGDAPEAGYGTFAYLRPPGGGLMVEVCSVTILPMFEKWWAGAELY